MGIPRQAMPLLPRCAAACLTLLAVVAADDEALASRARDLRSVSFGLGGPGAAAIPVDMDLTDDLDDFELILSKPGSVGPIVLLEEEATRAPSEFAKGRLPDIPGVPAAFQSVVKAVVKCFAYAASQHQAELKSKAPDAIAANADQIFPAISPGVTPEEMGQIRGSLAKIADLLNFGSAVDRLPDIMGIPGLPDAGQKSLKQMLKHVFDGKRKQDAYPEGALKPGTFGHYSIKVTQVPKSKQKLSSDAAHSPPAAEHNMPLPAGDDDDPTTFRSSRNTINSFNSSHSSSNSSNSPYLINFGQLNLTRKTFDQIHQASGNQTSVREMGDHLVSRMTVSKGGLSEKAQRCETICGVPEEVDAVVTDAAVASFLEGYWRDARLDALNKALRSMPHLARMHAAVDNTDQAVEAVQAVESS